MTRKTFPLFVLTILLLVALPLSRFLNHLLTESWWFDSVGYSSVFWKSLTWEGLLGGLVFLLFIAVLGGHYWISLRLTRDRPYRAFELTELAPYSDVIVRSASQIIIGLIALAAATSTASSWSQVLQFLNAQPFNKADPIFAQDIGFYLFRLPFWDTSHQILQMLSIWSLALTATLYSLKGIFLPRSAGLTKSIQVHLTAVVVPFIALIGWGFWLDRYQLLNRSSGVVYGIGYTDANARVLGLNFMSIVTLITLILLATALKRFRQRLFLTTIIIFGVGWIGLLGVYPRIVQQFIVGPNELLKEKPYIANNIEATQDAYQLNNIQSENFNVNADLSRQDLDNNQATLGNVRLWDYRPLLQTYRQLQEIRSYYSFADADVDRYPIRGKIQQVMISARELATQQLPAQAQNWVNQQLKYTHGHGLVMSPVNRVTSDGLPSFFVKDIPPKSSVDLEVEQPSIYYGELTNSYIFTGTGTDEFDYPEGRQNALVRYSGSGGVPIGGILRKSAYAFELNNFQLLLSDYFNRDSRIHYNRNVLKRARHIAPFLRYDNDPYLVLNDDGTLDWIIDAYTVSDRYPYSEPSVASLPTPGLTSNRQINYIRNSVKVIVNAFTGDVQFCVVDPSDPIIQTYQKIFPQLFVSKDQISPSIQSHFRYPEDLFKIQTSQYLKYHMRDPEVYYNREDLWQIPKQVYEDKEILVEPYYIIMRLPEEQESEFILIQPFTPNKKDNMIAWMAARSDGEQYGSLIEYNFPKQSLVFGPRQIEARIDQDPQISQQFTLWSQSGSKVIRGNLIILPLENSLLYIEPIYLRAEKAELPELKRIVVAYDKSVVMADTFEKALGQIFGSSQTATLPTPSPATSTQQSPIAQNSGQSFDALAQSALETYEQAEAAARQGDWAKYGQLQQELRSTLQKLAND
ncbi:MAG: UPF0182 family protein [Cyanobacteria bacterium P01_F01_bin.42]